MKTEPERDLLVDLAKLLRKYGPEPFESLAILLDSPETAAKLAGLLKNASAAAHAAGLEHGRPMPRKEDEVERLLSSIKIQNAEKFEILAPLAQELKSKILLPSSAELRRALESFGIAADSKEKRLRLISQLISQLSRMSVDELHEPIHQLHTETRSEGSLAGWAGLIMRETPK